MLYCRNRKFNRHLHIIASHRLGLPDLFQWRGFLYKFRPNIYEFRHLEN